MCQPTSPGYSSDGNRTGTEPPRPAAGADQRVVRGPQRGRGTGDLEWTTLRAGYPDDGTSPRRPVAGHTLRGKYFPDGFPAGGGNVWIDGTAYGDIPVPLELLNPAAVHGASLPNSRAPGIQYPGGPHMPPSGRYAASPQSGQPDARSCR